MKITITQQETLIAGIKAMREKLASCGYTYSHNHLWIHPMDFKTAFPDTLLEPGQDVVVIGDITYNLIADLPRGSTYMVTGAVSIDTRSQLKAQGAVL